MNPLIPLATTLLLCLSLLPTLTAFVVDTDGELIRNSGGSYYVVPSGRRGGGLSLTKGEGSSPCPLYITRKHNSLGVPLRVSSPLRILAIPVSARVKINFNSNDTTCEGPLEWQVKTDLTAGGQSYVTVGGGASSVFSYSFTIEEAGTKENTYKIRYCRGDDEHACSDLGFFKKNGLLGVTNEKPFLFQFKKAEKNLGKSTM